MAGERKERDATGGAYIGLAEAARLAPGRPSANCVWRWCRRGVLARDGSRVRLEHVRAGGKIYTSTAWVEAFMHRLAGADERYFNETDGRVSAGRADRRAGKSPRTLTNAAIDENRRVSLREQLEEAGL